ncbi:L-threonylcarbamoyladenylate synthase [Streptomyces sp. NPDC098789]|uniref:L-threonylcarbamoyladenylate synthase n=1 Tax=Streptomyces sp. NPDC098789 TaxID=3366098 RepID=UPI0038257D47
MSSEDSGDGGGDRADGEVYAPGVRWSGGLQQEAVDVLAGGGGLVVAPAKIGYALMTTDRQGLERKFAAKNRSRAKPGVVMCASVDQLLLLARTNEEIRGFITDHWHQDLLLGCVLPWRNSGLAHVPDGAGELVMDARGTSCFVIRCGAPVDPITATLWERHGKVTFASSANPSGRGNRGTIEGIGRRIAERADLLVEADGYVRSVQPGSGPHDRYAQGVMVSMVDYRGGLVPRQTTADAGSAPAARPTVIRRGLDVDRVMLALGRHFPAWDYRHGAYH